MKVSTQLKRWSYAILVSIACSYSTYAQIPEPPKSAQSPSAANIGTYGTYEVSQFTGKPDISVDLHTISEGNIQIPISLNYDGTGVKPDIHPGWTGLNFNLSTTYSVVRTINDNLDEDPGFLGPIGYRFGDTTAVLNYRNPDWNTEAKLKSVGLASYRYDTQTDEFNFTAPGLSGQFYYGQDGQWKIICDRPVTVKLYYTPTSNTWPPFSPTTWTGNPYYSAQSNYKYLEQFQGFIITDEFGTQYIFGGGDNAYSEYSLDFFNQGKANWTCNSWHLKSIVRHTGQTINFTYTRGDFVAQMYFSVYNKYGKVNGGSSFSCESWSSLISEYGAYNGKLISPIYLSEITGDNFKVKYISSQSTELRYTENVFSTYFNRLVAISQRSTDFLAFLYDCPGGCTNPLPLSTLLNKLQWRKLDKIQIENSSGVRIKEFELTYNNESTARLMLQKVQEKSGDGTKTIPPYEFTYFTDPSLKLPGYSLSHTDHWGFNNGKIINSTTDFNAGGSYGSTYRSPDTDTRYGKLGILTQIKYPTGGLTKYWFEPHKYAKEVKLKRWEGVDPFTSNQLAGGLRIKEIHNYDNAGNPMVKQKYFYVSGFNPASPDTTNLLSSGVLGGKTQYYWPDYKPKPEDPSQIVLFEIFSTQSVLPGTENSMGSHIGYSEVVEYSSDGGWTVNKFTNFENGNLDEAPDAFLQESVTAYEPYNSNAYKRGKVISKEIYKQNGNPATKTTYSYESVGLAANNVRNIKAIAYGLCQSDNRYYEGTAFTIKTLKYLPTQEITQSYDVDNAATFTTDTRKYYYLQATGQLYSVNYNDSRGIPLVDYKTFPIERTDPVSLGMTAKNIIGNPIEVVSITNDLSLGFDIKRQTITYASFSGNYLPKTVETKIGTGPTVKNLEMTYDPRGNLLTYKELNGITTKLEYYGTSDIGKVDLLKKKTVGDGTSLAQVTTYDYEQLIGINNIVDPNGKSITYAYDKLNRLETVKNASGDARASYCYNYAGQLAPCDPISPTGTIYAPTITLVGDLPAGPLPVTLLEFTAARKEKTAMLNWSTTFETASERFDIERSKDGMGWSKIGSIDAQGESKELRQYSFNDNTPLNGENLYRLKMVDTDGTFAYSRIQSVIFDGNANVSLYPNPLTIGDRLNLLTDDLTKISHIKIFNASGKLVYQSTASKEINTSNLSSGLYLVQISFKDGGVINHRVVKQ